MTDTIIGALIGLGGAVVGAIASYFFSKKLISQSHENAIEIIKINEFNRAATRFRDTFAEELATLKSREKGDTPIAGGLLNFL